MAQTIQTSANALTKKLFDEKLFRDQVKDTFFGQFMKESSDAIVHVKTQLEKGQGDKITFGIRMRLAGDGVTDDQLLEGNEEALTSYEDDVTLVHYRHAVRTRGKLHEKRAVWNMMEEHRSALKDWGTEKIDALCFTTLLNNRNRVYYPTGTSAFAYGSEAAAKAALHATNSKLSLDFLTLLKTVAKTGAARTTGFVPIRPIKVDGKDTYILLAHPDCLADLKMSSEYKQAQREAQVRGEKNPLFTGADAVWNGVIIYEHENCTIANDGGGASVAWAKCAFMGAQSLVWGWGERPETVEEKFDYQNQKGIGWGFMAGVTHPVFNSVDYGSFGVYLARTKISDL